MWRGRVVVLMNMINRIQPSIKELSVEFSVDGGNAQRKTVLVDADLLSPGFHRCVKEALKDQHGITGAVIHRMEI